MKKALILMLVLCMLLPLPVYAAAADEAPAQTGDSALAEAEAETEAEKPNAEPEAAEPAAEAEAAVESEKAPYRAETLEQALADAEAGNAEAMAWLGYLYAHGKFKLGVKRDFAESLAWYLKAAEAGIENEEIFIEIAQMYAAGVGAEKDLDSAYAWYKKAADLGSEQAQEAMSDKKYDLARMRANRVSLSFQLGDRETVINKFVYTYYLDKPVLDCSSVMMDLQLVKYTGYPFGTFSLYAKDLSGRWHKIDYFKIKKLDDNTAVRNYIFQLPEPMSIEAFAIGLSEQGMDFNIQYEPTFYVDSELVGEYSDEIPAPVFTPADVEYAVIDPGFVGIPYTNPFASIMP